MSKANRGYAIKYETNTITITREFSKRAQEFGSPEYKQLRGLMKDYPQMSIEMRKAAPAKNKECHKGLSYGRMRTYIELICEDSAPWLGKLDTILVLSKCQNGSYSYVKKWFLANFPNYNEAIEAAANQ